MKTLHVFIKLISLLLVFITPTLFAQSIAWQQLNGPFGGTVLSFASNSSGDIFAGADQDQRGIFRSTDGGLTWQPKSTGLYLDNRAFSWLVVDDSSYIIAGTNSHIGERVYKSKDNGESWSQIAVLGGTCSAINDSGHIYAGNTGYGQYSVSKDGGYTWTHYPHPSPFIRCIEINDSGHIFIGGNYTAYRSTDNGATWTTLSGGITSEINSIAFNVSGHIFAGNWQEYGSQSGILKSTDNGDTWTTVKLGFRVNSSHNIVINSSGDIIVGSWGWGIWKSTDNGDTWTQHNTGLGHPYIKSMHISYDGNIYAGTSGGGIYRSADNGESWQQVGVTSANVKRVAISPANGNFFALVNGVSRSADNGESWEPVNNGLVNYDTRSIKIKNDGTIFIGCGIPNWAYPDPCIFRSTDNGNSWSVIENGIQRHDVQAITIDTSGNVYAGNYYGVYKSTNNGDNWINIGGVGGALTLAFNSVGDLFLASYGQGLWKLPAGDTEWVNLTSNIGTIWIYSFFISNNDYLFADDKHSTDNGQTWLQMNGIQSGVSSFSENSVGHLFCGTFNYGSGVFRSTDNGENWTAINTGLPIMDIRSVGVDSDDYLYAGTNGFSMFKTTKSTVSAVDIAKTEPSTFFLENFPNPFERSTVIRWQNPVACWQTLKVYDMYGKEIATLVNEYKPAGKHEADFDGISLQGGIFFYMLKAADYVCTGKMILVR